MTLVELKREGVKIESEQRDMWNDVPVIAHDLSYQGSGKGFVVEDGEPCWMIEDELVDMDGRGVE